MGAAGKSLHYWRSPCRHISIIQPAHLRGAVAAGPGRCAHARRCNCSSPGNPAASPEIQQILCVSDIHTDYAENLAWVHALDPEAHQQDLLILAGDACDELGLLEDTLGALRSRFAALAYVPGNHEAWVKASDRRAGVADSVDKLGRVLALCRRLGVITAPQRFGDLWVVPILSWHHQTWDGEPDIDGVPPASRLTVADYAACHWPASLPEACQQAGGLALAQWWDSLNDEAVWAEVLATRGECDVISVSHFLPRQELLPEKRYLFYPNLAKASGSAPLARRLEALRPDIHVFGHTHFSWDATLDDGVRYVQAPLCSPAERRRRLRSLCFEASWAAAEADPAAATWLPLPIYCSREGPLHAAPGGRAQPALPPGSAAGQAGSEPGAASTAVSGEEDVEDASMRFAMLGGSEAPLSAVEDGAGHLRGGDGACASGAVPLRHGDMPADLGAHWSSYYAKFERRPSDTALAPWVAGFYHRRRQWRASREVAASDASSTGSGSESCSDASDPAE